MIEKEASYRHEHDHISDGPGAGVVVIAGMSAISGAVVGFLLAGDYMAAGGLFIFSVLAAWLGWLARGFA